MTDVPNPAINPHTVLTAYRHLKQEALGHLQPVLGPYGTRSLPGTDPSTPDRFLAPLTGSLDSVPPAGRGSEAVEATYGVAIGSPLAQGVA